MAGRVEKEGEGGRPDALVLAVVLGMALQSSAEATQGCCRMSTEKEF